MTKSQILPILVAIGAWHTASAQPYVPVHVVQRIPGWQCMALASQYGSQGSYAPPTPVFAGPSEDAPKVGIGAGTVIVPDPLRPVNGRTEMIWSNGKRVWIDVKALTTWHALAAPKAACHPALLSNGRYGTTTSE